MYKPNIKGILGIESKKSRTFLRTLWSYKATLSKNFCEALELLENIKSDILSTIQKTFIDMGLIIYEAQKIEILVGLKRVM